MCTPDQSKLQSKIFGQINLGMSVAVQSGLISVENGMCDNEIDFC